MILLWLQGVQGDSTVKGYTDWISCNSIGWSLVREIKDSAKAGTQDLFTGVSEVAPMELAKSFDRSSPILMKLGAGGGALGGATGTGLIHLIMSGAGGETIDEKDPKDNVYCKFKMAGPLVKSWAISGGEDERPGETLSLWYYKISFFYKQFAGKDSSGAYTGSWDRTKNTPWKDGPGSTWDNYDKP
ncbi:MAG: type VI secretion system tube protein Hcp [Planctomycetota bacterium]|nr:type VI secretion system tube protein Hcp [Planctomycetota bacterium]